MLGRIETFRRFSALITPAIILVHYSRTSQVLIPLRREQHVVLIRQLPKTEEHGPLSVKKSALSTNMSHFEMEVENLKTTESLAQNWRL